MQTLHYNINKKKLYVCGIKVSILSDWMSNVMREKCSYNEILMMKIYATTGKVKKNEGGMGSEAIKCIDTVFINVNNKSAFRKIPLVGRDKN